MTSRSATVSKVGAKPPQANAQVKWPARSQISIFIRCLHLLDLDLLENWPGIVDATFTTKTAQQNAQNKVKAVEWSLYRLFEIYNGEDTADKLRPFFPPITHLQSLNLRAALYRCLTDLKKNGRLSPHIQLRKTMLDECKGDKFEEAIAAFAMIVLRKVTKDRNPAVLAKNSEIPNDAVVPLILAYKHTLSSNLEQRRQIDQETEQLLGNLRKANVELLARKKELVATSRKPEPAADRAVTDLVNESWAGNHAWADLMLKGPPPKAAYENAGTADGTVTIRSVDTGSTADQLVGNLDAQIRKHRNRLAEWKLIAKDLAAKDLAPAAVNFVDFKNSAVKKASRFEQHQHLTLGHCQAKSARPSIHADYSAIHEAMRNELRNSTSSRNVQVRRDAANLMTVPQPVPKLESNMSAHIGVPQFQKDLVPIETPLAESKSPYDQVDIPSHDSEFQRPNANNAWSVTSPEMPLRLRTVGEEATYLSAKYEAGDNILESSPISSIPDEHPSMIWTSPSSGLNAEKASSLIKVSERIPSPDGSPKQVMKMEPPTSPSKEWMSLMDRTRASISTIDGSRHPSGLDYDMSDVQTPRPLKQQAEMTPLQEEEENAFAHSRRTTLAERTRQSMSLFTSTSFQEQKQHSRRSQMHRQSRISQHFPVNQFETPGRPAHRRVSAFGPSSEASTPREKLFEEEADYDSVFKSRPKIAMSPIMNSEREETDEDGIGLDSILEQDMDGLQLASDDEYD